MTNTEFIRIKTGTHEHVIMDSFICDAELEFPDVDLKTELLLFQRAISGVPVSIPDKRTLMAVFAGWVLRSELMRGGLNGGGANGKG